MPSCVYAFVMKNVQIIKKLNKLSQNSKQVFWLSWLLSTGSFLLNKSVTFLITGRIDSVTCIWLPAVNGKQELCETTTEVYFVLLSCWHQYIFACIIFVTAFCECRSSKRMITLNFFFGWSWCIKFYLDSITKMSINQMNTVYTFWMKITVSLK